MAEWCAREERCQHDAFQRMRRHGLTRQEADEIVAFLVSEGYINEERFARAYARGHFRMKNWGRQKIIYGLKQKQISPYCIAAALREIEDEDHEKLLEKLAEAKWKSVGRATPAQRWSKTQRYLLQKGFSYAEITKILRKFSEK